MKKLYILLYVILTIFLSSFAYAYVYASPNSFTKQFYNYTPNYLRNNLEINFVSQYNIKYDGYCYCWNKPYGKIKITIYKNNWEANNYEHTREILDHELKHAYQCKVLNEYPSHGKNYDNLGTIGVVRAITPSTPI